MKHSNSKLTSIVASVSLVSAMAVTPIQAAPDKNLKEGLKGAATVYSAAIIGGLAAGPVGFFIGAIGGAKYHEGNKEDALLRADLDDTKSEVAVLEAEVDSRKDQIKQLEKSAANKLEFTVMFPTGDDKLTPVDEQRIKSLSTYLNDNPTLRIRLDGHTDPRGTEEYNNLLSQERALSVANAFEEQGINTDRITWFAHGADFSAAYTGDLEAYAMERRVQIEVYVQDETNFASSNQTFQVQ